MSYYAYFHIHLTSYILITNMFNIMLLKDVETGNQSLRNILFNFRKHHLAKLSNFIQKI